MAGRRRGSRRRRRGRHQAPLGASRGLPQRTEELLDFEHVNAFLVLRPDHDDELLSDPISARGEHERQDQKPDRVLNGQNCRHAGLAQPNDWN